MGDYSKGGMNRILIAAVVFLVMGVLGCSNGSVPPGAFSGELVDDTRMIELSLSNYKFSPRELVVGRGELVQFLVESTDSVHTFTVEELGINWTFAGDEKRSEEFIFSEIGEFRVLCIIPTHRTLGMESILIVR